MYFLTSIILIITAIMCNEMSLLIPSTVLVLAGEISELRRAIKDCVTIDILDEELDK